MTPLDSALAVSLLETGMFVPVNTVTVLEIPRYWARELGLDDDGRKMRVRVNLEPDPSGGVLRLYIEPSIQSYEQHVHRRIPASCALEFAARYAEKVGGVVQEMANVPGCEENGIRAHVIASYPETRMDYGLLCRGYQDAFGLAI